MANDTELSRLEKWYKSQANGEWEHAYGITIESIDNPGWHIKIELQGTELEARQFNPTKLEKGDDDWYFCKVEKKEFLGYSSPEHLKTIIKIFNEWAK